MKLSRAVALIAATVSMASYAEQRIDPYEKSEPIRTQALCLHVFLGEPRTPNGAYVEGLCEGMALGAITALGVMVQEFRSYEGKRNNQSAYVHCLDQELRHMGRQPRVALIEAMEKDRSHAAAMPMSAVYSAMKNRLIRRCDTAKSN